MKVAVADRHVPVAELVESFSLEMTAKDIESLTDAAGLIPAGTPISVTYLPGEEMPARVAAAHVVKQLGFVPVPHISARRVLSRADLLAFLTMLNDSVGI